MKRVQFLIGERTYSRGSPFDRCTDVDRLLLRTALRGRTEVKKCGPLEPRLFMRSALERALGCA